MGQALLKFDLERVIVGITRHNPLRNRPQFRINPEVGSKLLGWNSRVGCGRSQWPGVCITKVPEYMPGTVSHIRHIHQEVRSNRALNAEIPLVGARQLKGLVQVGNADRRRPSCPLRNEVARWRSGSYGAVSGADAAIRSQRKALVEGRITCRPCTNRPTPIRAHRAPPESF